jgi:LysM repeat protein
MRFANVQVAGAISIAAITVTAVPGLQATAGAAAIHQVSRGETLWSIARRDGLSVSSLASANGIAPGAALLSGAVLHIPSRAATGVSPSSTGLRTIRTTRASIRISGTGVASPRVVVTSGEPPGDDEPGRPEAVAPSEPTGPAPLGAYTVRPGDTLSGLALQSRVSAGEIAFMNGLSPSAHLRAGTLIKLPTGAPAPVRSVMPAPLHRVVSSAGPYPTAARLSSGQIETIAAHHGVPAALAAAIAWQESGFNNGLVSSANARGVMQLLPGTWDWVQRTLAGHPLDPYSPRDNVTAGVLYLRSLLRNTAGNSDAAAAAYYQGLGSVRRIGLLPDTRRYVTSVRSLRARFGGP